MLFRLRFLGMIAFVIALASWEISLQAQGTTNFAAWKEAKNADDISEWARRLLIRDFRDVSGPAREELLAKTLFALKEIAADSNVVPSTRYNAILTIGQLVSQEANPGSGNLPAAYPAALPYLLDLYQEAEAPHYLQYGALLGIVRHTICGMEPAQRDRVIDLLLETIITEHSVSEIALDLGTVPLESAVWDWFRLTALDGLSALKTAGMNGKVVTELLSVITNKSQELEDLCRRQDLFTRGEWEQTRRAMELASKAAKTLGDLDYPSATGIDPEIITDTFVTFIKTVCDIEHKMVADAMGQDNSSLLPTVLIEQIVIDLKTCIQSVFWGIRREFLTGRPAAEHSFFLSLKSEAAKKRAEALLSALIELSAFLDEGDKENRQSTTDGAGANAPKKFKFDLPDLRDMLAKSSETLAKMGRKNEDPPGIVCVQSSRFYDLNVDTLL